MSSLTETAPADTQSDVHTETGLRLRAKSRRHFFYTLLSLLVSAPVYYWAGPLWLKIQPLQAGSFVLAALGYGLLLVLGPLCAIGFALTTLFLRVEASFAPGERPRGFADYVSVILAFVLTVAPAFGGAYPALMALRSGSVRFKLPEGQVLRSVDPLGYWQGVAFWLMGGAALLILAGVYWRSRWLRRKQPT